MRLLSLLALPLALACTKPSESRTLDGEDAGDSPSAAAGRSHHVAPSGSPHGDGSANAPWDLPTALNQPEVIQPGDTVWLHGGIYKGKFISRLAGTAEAPIVLRQAPGERATIEGNLNVGGESAVFWGFEVKNTSAERPDEAGVSVRSPRSKFINLAVHDHGGNGFSFAVEALDAEIYGSLVYNNGSMKNGSEPIGQGIAAQNKDGEKRIEDNILFNQFASGIQIYGSDAVALKNFHIAGNASFSSGRPDLLVGGGSAASGIVVNANYTYRTDKGTTAVFGNEWGPTNGDLALTDNVFVGSTKIITWDQITAMRNAFAGAETLLMLRIPATATLTPDYDWRDNSYVAAEGKWQPFNLSHGPNSVGGFFLPDWQQKTGLDKGSKYARGQPTGVSVFVRPNRYEPGRANVVVYNWDRQATVKVDLKDAMKRGARYEVRSAQDFFGAPVSSGTYDGQAIMLPMRANRAKAPVGSTAQVAATGPEFDVFVVLPAPAAAPAKAP